jgi:hypothetical protein
MDEMLLGTYKVSDLLIHDFLNNQQIYLVETNKCDVYMY